MRCTEETLIPVVFGHRRLGSRNRRTRRSHRCRDRASGEAHQKPAWADRRPKNGEYLGDGESGVAIVLASDPAAPEQTAFAVKDTCLSRGDARLWLRQTALRA